MNDELAVRVEYVADGVFGHSLFQQHVADRLQKHVGADDCCLVPGHRAGKG